jgi:hypothetical protein
MEAALDLIAERGEEGVTLRELTDASLTSPVSLSTFRCWEIAGCVTEKCEATSPALNSPSPRSRRISRRVGCATASKISI